ncbi:MAG: hypothetical protein QMD10_12775 [Desulfitobacteriaceae bacterium]|nr:hypothetical protein [Desulfitobacteriaceae bacterium]
MQIIADTNFLMIPGMFGVDVVSELEKLLDRRYKLVILSPVMRELEQISEKGKPKERVAARIGLMLVKRGSVIKAKGGADESILNLATNKQCAVGTTDAALRKELRRRGIPVIYLRQKSHLAVDGWI